MQASPSIAVQADARDQPLNIQSCSLAMWNSRSPFSVCLRATYLNHLFCHVH